MLTKYSLEDIEFEVPSLWGVSEIDGAIEILDAQEQGALHLSILRRTRTDALSESDARLLVENFASNNGLVPEASITSKMQASEARAIGSFRPIRPTQETPLHWLVGCIVWPNRALRASYCTDSLSTENLKLATAVIDSIRSRGS
jgi:hypothetical protein